MLRETSEVRNWGVRTNWRYASAGIVASSDVTDGKLQMNSALCDLKGKSTARLSKFGKRMERKASHAFGSSCEGGRTDKDRCVS